MKFKFKMSDSDSLAKKWAYLLFYYSYWFQYVYSKTTRMSKTLAQILLLMIPVS